MRAAPVLAVAVALAGAWWPAITGAQRKPIIAVFTVESRGVRLDADTLDRLSDYLATSLTATGHYQVVPRDQLKRRLVQQKQDSYKRCFDQSCQIDIGKELAAQKSLASQVIKLGSRCMVTATLYDLRAAAAERGATAKGGCDEDQIVGSLETVVSKLVPRSAPRVRDAAPPPPAPRWPGPPPSPGPPAQQIPEVAVDFVSQPVGAELFLDGQARGRTPLRVHLAKGRTYALGLEKDGYRTRNDEILVQARRRVNYTLDMTPAGLHALRTRTEWIALEALGGAIMGAEDRYYGSGPSEDFVTSATFGAGGLMVQLFTLKWEHFFWTIFEIGGAGGESGTAGTFSRVGYPLYFGSTGAHQIRFGLGLGGGVMDDGAGLLLTPTLHYQYQTAGRFFIGFGVRSIVPLVGDSSIGSFPAAVLISVPLGWASAPM